MFSILEILEYKNSFSIHRSFIFIKEAIQNLIFERTKTNYMDRKLFFLRLSNFAYTKMFSFKIQMSSERTII